MMLLQLCRQAWGLHRQIVDVKLFMENIFSNIQQEVCGKQLVIFNFLRYYQSFFQEKLMGRDDNKQYSHK